MNLDSAEGCDIIKDERDRQIRWYRLSHISFREIRLTENADKAWMILPVNICTRPVSSSSASN